MSYKVCRAYVVQTTSQKTKEDTTSSTVHKKEMQANKQTSGLLAEKAKVLCSALSKSRTDPNLGVAAGTLRMWDYRMYWRDSTASLKKRGYYIFSRV